MNIKIVDVVEKGPFRRYIDCVSKCDDLPDSLDQTACNLDCAAALVHDVGTMLNASPIEAYTIVQLMKANLIPLGFDPKLKQIQKQKEEQ